ncbi:NADPH:quinone reductase [Actinobacteria bacterium OK074]|nr:NADPH:quinone reductase [Actinobacteria bacterium OK074]
MEVAAVGVNFADLLTVTGQFHLPTELPMTPGNEFSGTVSAVGPGVTRVAPGDRVMALTPRGGYADRAVVPELLTVRLPVDMDLVTAAAAPVAYATAHVALVAHGRLKAGQTVVVTGASGSVGRATMESARELGATVIGVRRTAAAGPGAAHHSVFTADRTGDEVTGEIRALTGGRGADLAVDLVGGPLTASLLDAAAFGGTVLTVGFASGEVPQVSLGTLLMKTVGIAGFDLGLYLRERHEFLAGALDRTARLMASGVFRPGCAQSLPLHAAPKVLSAMQRAELPGKTVLVNE